VNDRRAGASAGGTSSGAAMINRGEISAKMDPFKDVSELGYQPL